jgi:flagellar assembly protein FliH
MSSSSSAAVRKFVVAAARPIEDTGDGTARRPVGNPALTRARVLRGLAFDRAPSPLDAELPARAPDVDPAEAAAGEQRGYDDGYRAGMAEGLAAGRAAMAAESAAAVARLEAVVAALADAAADLRSRQALELAGLEDALARAAVDLAAAIIGREVRVAESPGADALARALSLVPAGSAAVARLHPADAAVLTEEPRAAALIAPDSVVAAHDPARRAAVPAGVTIVPDPAIEPGGCILEVGDSRIDAQLGPALDRVRAALLGDRP